MMEKTNNPAGDIPAFLAGTLDEAGSQRLKKALAESAELRHELDLWKKMRALVKVDAARQAAGHLSPEAIIDLVEGRIRETGEIGKHLLTCDDCREDVETIRLTYSVRKSNVPEARPSIIDTVLEYFTMPRIGYALGIVAAVIVVASGIVYYMSNRIPEWKQLQADADSKAEQGMFDAAKDIYQRALESADPLAGENAGDISAIVDSLASISSRNGDYAEARRLLGQSLTLKKTGGLEGTWSSAWVFEQLGNLERITGNDLSAESLFSRADEIREELAKASPEDQSLQRYRRNVALIRLVPQIGFRGPETPPFPSVDFDDVTTHVEFLIVLRRNRDISASYIPALTTPTRQVLPIPDTLSVDPLHPAERTLRLTLSERFFEEGKGTYRIGIRKLADSGTSFEDVYFFQLP